jgi:hypothetical protein
VSSPAANPLEVGAPPQVPQSEGDMIDTAAEIESWTPLPLAECAPVNEAFFALDDLALRHQRWHRRLTLTATMCGGGAVLIAVWILGFGRFFAGLEAPLTTLELLLVGLAFAAIVVGIREERKIRWLVNRHKAELLRLLKFEFLTTPSVWSGGRPAGSTWVNEKIQAISAVRDRRGLEAAVSTARITEETTSHAPIASATLLKLVEYYLGKRLNPQKEYLANRAQRNDFWDGALQRNVNTTLLFMSVAAVVLQDAVNWWGVSKPVYGVLFTTLGAASLPVIASMIRTLRSAFEFSRNRSRFLAAHDALSKLEQRLTHHLLWARTSELTPEHEAMILRELERCEAQLRTEHNEWLRLMLEAEWFG